MDRLLKRQAPRTRGRRIDSGTSTPALVATAVTSERNTPGLLIDDEEQSNMGDVPDGGSTTGSGTGSLPAIQLPTTFRWISTSKGSTSILPMITVLSSSIKDEASMQIDDDEAAPKETTTSTAEQTGMDIDNPSEVADNVLSITDDGSVPSITTSNEDDKVTRSMVVSTLPPTFSLSLSIPSSLISQLPSAPSSSLNPANPNGKRGRSSHDPISLSSCGVDGCDKSRKYRVQLNPGEEKGACGLEHFRVLKGITV